MPHRKTDHSIFWDWGVDNVGYATSGMAKVVFVRFERLSKKDGTSLIKNIVIMKTQINLSVYLIVLFFTLTACGERTDGLYGTRYSRSELEEMGVNTEHLFIFDGDKITYNGKEFWPGMSIEEVTEIFGEPYTRTYKGKAFFHEYITYFWDDWGVMVSTQLRDGIQTVMMVDIRWNLTIGKALELANDDDLRDLVKSMKLKTFIIIGFISTSCLGGCAQRSGPLGEKTIKLDDFDFFIPITDIFPDRYISAEWGEDWYQMPSPCTEDGHLYQKETRKTMTTAMPFGLLIASRVTAMPTSS